MLLSRTAASLYWLARYVERAENTARILDAASRLASLPQTYGGSSNEWESAVIATGGHELFKELYSEATAATVIDFLGFSARNPSSIRSCLEAARKNARTVRTAITIEMWEAINAAWIEQRRFNGAAMNRQQIGAFLTFVREACLRFDGSAYRTMLRTDAYSFFRLGVYVERGDCTARILDVKYHVLLPEGGRVGGGVDYFQWSAILRSVSALNAYHWVYRDSLRPYLVADLLILRPEMPRSIVSCYENIVRFLEQLGEEYGRQGPSQRTARAHFATLQDLTIGDVFGQGLHEFLLATIAENNRLGARISDQYLT